MKWIIIALCFLNSCSGYRFRNQRNPLEEEGIKSISVPMFINKSSIPNTSHVFTTSIIRVLGNSTDIKIYMGDNRKADALLIGIIDSPKRYKDLYEKGGTFFIDKEEKNEQSNSIGDRSSFYIPLYRTYKLRIRLVLIRHPSDLDRSLIKSDLLPYLRKSQKIIFNNVIEKEWGAGHSIRGTETIDSAGITNVSRSRYYFEQSLRDFSTSVANDFRDLVLNAF